MTHRAQQVVDAMVANLTANTGPGWTVYRGRSASLNRDELELPAASVVLGADRPLSELGQVNVAFIDSLLEVAVVLVATDPDETNLLATLMEMRRQVHVSLMADRSQGLAFVIDTRYQGADEPSFSVDKSIFSGVLHSRWRVHYRTNISDPS